MMKRIEFQKHVAVLCTAFLLLSCCFSSLIGQSEFKGIPLGESVNTEYDELVPRISPNGQRMYFARLQHPSNVGGRNSGQDIWFSDRNPDGTWGAAQNLGPSLNNQHHNSIGGVAAGGKTLFLANTYDIDPREVRPGISFAKMGPTTWDMPKRIFGPSVVSDQGKSLDFFVTPDQKIMLISMTKAGEVKPDLYVSTLIEEGLYSLPKSLGDIINFPESSETTPSLSQDAKMLFFTSDVEGGMGSGDIYFAERLDDSWINWSEPQNLGPEVNTAGYDGHFVMGYDGMYAYFVSGKTPTANGDIYEVELKNLKLFKEEVGDTLHVTAKAGQPLKLELDEYGINPENIRLIAHRMLVGQGNVRLPDNATNFEYLSPPGYSGADLFEFLICDPPQSDDCERVLVIAEVEKPAVPVIASYSLKTLENTPVSLDARLPEWSQSRTLGAYESYPGPKGKIATGSEVGQGNLVYTPPLDFVGQDSIPVLGPCPDGFSSNCLKAVIHVTIDPNEVVAVVKEPVKEPVLISTPSELEIGGFVFDDATGFPMASEIIFYDGEKEVGKTSSDKATGAYKITLPNGRNYTLAIRKEDYFPVFEGLKMEKDATIKAVNQDFRLTPVPVKAVEPVVAIEPPKELKINGHVLDDPSGFPLASEIVFYDGEKEVGRTSSDEVTGAYSIELPNGKDYAFSVEQEFYFPFSDVVKKGKGVIKGNVNQDIRLTPVPLVEGQTFVLKDIYFDTNKSTLKPESKAELMRLQDLMRRNPGMEIEVRGHTDSQSDDAHNQALSDSRAAAVINYLKYQGVMGYRLGSKGYGETKPIATNETEEGRALNRRVEFYIKKM